MGGTRQRPGYCAFGLGRLLTDLPAGRLADAVAPTVGLAAAGALLALSCGMLAAAESLAYAGPRGEVHMRRRHLDQRVYLAEAHDLQLDVVAQL